MLEEKLETKQCKKCKENIPKNAERCKYCGAHTISWFGRHIILSLIIIFIAFIFIVNIINNDSVSQPPEQAPALSAEELAAKAKIQAEEQATFDKTPAGKICKQNPGWSRDDCQKIVDKKIWIGMTYDMLVAVIGRKPNSANPSNYGSGTQWQWCWYDMQPSCFYGSDDRVIDAYN
jgi:hypothetical protein